MESKDIQIARMNALRTAAQLIAAFPDKIKAEGSDGVITTTLKVADKLYTWVMNGYDVPELPKPEHRKDPTAYDESRGQTTGGVGGKTGAANINVKRVSKKQYGYLCSLYKQLGQEPDYDTLNWISSKDASGLIEELVYQVQKHGGNGNGNTAY